MAPFERRGSFLFSKLLTSSGPQKSIKIFNVPFARERGTLFGFHIQKPLSGFGRN
nr:MAG TPA: hypothetical protein [Caudoviricetes sp.]